MLNIFAAVVQRQVMDRMEVAREYPHKNLLLLSSQAENIVWVEV